MDHLFRSLAPISEVAWAEIDDEASRSLRTFLAGRRLVDFSGPHGWDHAAVTDGRLAPVRAPCEGVEAATRTSLQLVELRAPFTLSRSELDAVGRGAPDPDLDPVVDAARQMAAAEDEIVFAGMDGVMAGCATASPHPALEITDDYGAYPGLAAKAVATLQDAGIDGPYSIALGPRCYRGVIEGTELGGYPVIQHLRLILDGQVVRAPTVDGAVVLSQRGGDFELIVGQDLSVGYGSHDADSVALYISETVTFRVIEPAAAVRLSYPA